MATLLALLAWAALAFGAPLPLASLPDCTAGTAAPMVMDGAHAHPQLPAGPGDCCHPGCHCLAPFGVDVVVPPAMGSVAPAAQPKFQPATPASRAIMSAPPLRPPIA